ncbi:MAG TPA: plastocyanin/azurin family copper-binding protein [Solirubrobacterales bacterium]|nr:plastocyanin/azurin family copper-binding protein [Solirubrobacterales bacterium]
MRFWLLGIVVPLALAAMLVAGCGGSDSGETTTAENETAATGGGGGGGKRLEIKMGDYFFSPASGTTTAGKTVIEAPNEGAVEHELVLFKTNMDPAKLPTEAGGGVDEEKLDEIAEEAGEVPDVEAGETKSGKFDLTPGRYVIFCNLPGHYAQGMYGTLTVK